MPFFDYYFVLDNELLIEKMFSCLSGNLFVSATVSDVYELTTLRDAVDALAARMDYLKSSFFYSTIDNYSYLYF